MPSLYLHKGWDQENLGFGRHDPVAYFLQHILFIYYWNKLPSLSGHRLKKGPKWEMHLHY